MLLHPTTMSRVALGYNSLFLKGYHHYQLMVICLRVCHDLVHFELELIIQILAEFLLFLGIKFDKTFVGVKLIMMTILI